MGTHVSPKAGEETSHWGNMWLIKIHLIPVWFEFLFLDIFTPDHFPGIAEQLQKVQAKVRIWICVSGSPPTPHLWKLLFGADTGISRVICYFCIFIISSLKQVRDRLPEAWLSTSRFCTETCLRTTSLLFPLYSGDHFYIGYIFAFFFCFSFA